MPKLESLQYSRGSFKVLDQLLLPHETKFIDVVNVQDAWSVIRTMQVRGAPLIAITAALGLAAESENRKGEFANNLDGAAEFLLSSMVYLKTSRPTAVNLFTAMDELTALVNTKKVLPNQTAEGLLNAYIQAAEELWIKDIATNRAIGLHGANKILEIVGKETIKVLTICNTGSLATAGFGTALGVVRALHELGKLEHVYACETRPYNQGARLTAYEIVTDELPGTLIADSMASALMAIKGVDCVVIGADRVAGNGDTANKIGSYQLAIAAKYHRIPFFVAAPTTTLDLSMSSGAEIHIEERPADEMTKIFGQRIAPEGINVWNPAFDVTPCALIRGIITELGVIEPEFIDPKGMSRNSDTVIPVADFLASKLKADSLTEGDALLLGRVATAAQPISVPIGYERMDPSRIAGYVVQQKKLVNLLQLTQEDVDNEGQILKIDEVGDGNLNYVYLIEGRNGASIVIKQALPFVRCVGENWPLSLQRALFELQALVAQSKYTGGEYVPEVYAYDNSKCILVMRFIEPPHLILRKQLIEGQKINTFANDLGIFLAKTLFKSSGLNITGGDFRFNVAQWSRNVALCALTEKVIFTDPYTNSPLNHWTSPQLDQYVHAIRVDSELKLAASYHKQLFVTSTQALLHGDLHTGSIMVKEGSTFVIDPEFAFYGPIGFDLGAILANLYLSYFSYSVRDNVEYSEWILQQIQILYHTFADKFIELWEIHAKEAGEFYIQGVYTDPEILRAQRDFMASIWHDTLGFAGSKMIRRIVGIAHVEDLESIENPEQRSLAEKRALLFGRSLVLASFRNNLNIENKLVNVDLINEVARQHFVMVPPAEWPHHL